MINVKKIEFFEEQKNNLLFLGIKITFLNNEIAKEEIIENKLEFDLGSAEKFVVEKVSLIDRIVIADYFKVFFAETVAGFYVDQFKNIENIDEFIDMARSLEQFNENVWYSITFNGVGFDWVEHKNKMLKQMKN